MPKNIVVMSDGTGQEGGKGSPTNIYKIFRMLQDRSPEQTVFYDRGLGTGWRKLGGNMFGMGISENIEQCYRFIFDHYEAGDRIFLFGFSRGAATVRSLTGFLHLFGLLPKARPKLIGQAWKIYEISDPEQRKAKAEQFLQDHPNMWVRVNFLGVFDTVAALGVPSNSLSELVDRVSFLRHKFHNFKLSASVENAYHALSIDDERKTFHPVLWDAEILDHQRMEQVWFAGVHTDVGGGYPEPGLSDVALEWMLDKARACGITIYGGHKVNTAPDPHGVLHDPFKGLVPWRRETRSWDTALRGTPVVHESAHKRYMQADGNYKPWILAGPVTLVSTGSGNPKS